MKGIVQNFILMLQFLTRLPINLALPCEPLNFRRGTVFFPVVGLVIGAFQWLVFYFASMALPADITAILVVAAGVIITGALHLDGLGDVCDGFFAFKGKDRIIEIMKDSRIGTYSCIAVILDLMLRYACYSNLITHDLSFGIIAAPVISKTVFILLFYIGKQAKTLGTGNLFIGNVGIEELFMSFFIGISEVVFLLGVNKAPVIILAAVIATVVFNKYCEKKIGGLTGDTLGANNEIVEILTLILVVAVKI